MLKRKDGAAAVENTRLEAADWVRAAMDILAEQGMEAVRIEPLAKNLGITKGSFYWHFKDRNALLGAILDHWRRHATLDIIAQLENSSEGAASRLAKLLRLPFHGARSSRGAEVELSIRLWGRQDPRAHAALEEVDRLRLRYIEGLLQEVGFTSEEAAIRSIYCYAFMRVGGTLIDHRDEQRIADCLDLMLKR